MSNPPLSRQKYTPHKTLDEGWTYVSIPDDDSIIAVKIAVTKVMKLLDESGNPAKDPNTGLPSYVFQSTNVVKVLSKEEYDVEKKLKGGV